MCVSRRAFQILWVFRTPEYYNRDEPLTVSAGTTATWVISSSSSFKFEFTSSKKALRSLFLFLGLPGLDFKFKLSS